MLAKIALLCGLFAVGLPAFGQVHVRGYTRKDGTYVAPHYRSSPNSSRSDNYSSKGNFNPYTGKKGSQDPYRLPVRRSTYYPPVYTPPPQQLRSQYYQQPAPQPAQTVAVWRCIAANGAVSYLAYPRAGCDMVAAIPVQAAQPVYGYSQAAPYFHGYRCTDDCSGHEAGYQWAEDNGIEDPNYCDGNSQSFIEGCQAYSEEAQDSLTCDDEGAGDCE